jgi:hypothetical protein
MTPIHAVRKENKFLCAVCKVLASYRGGRRRVAGREAAICGTVEEVLHGNLGDLRNWQLALSTLGF